jgi:hypothetical protein
MFIKQKLSFSLKEIKKLYACSFTGMEEVLKLRFVIGCITGLYPEQYATINGKHLQDGKIVVYDEEYPYTTRIFPLHHLVDEIFEQNGYYLPEIPLENLELQLQTLLKKAKIRTRVFSMEFGYWRKQIRLLPKYKLIKPHMTRAFAIQNMKKAGLEGDAFFLAIGRTEPIPKGIRFNEKRLSKKLLQNNYFRQPW